MTIRIKSTKVLNNHTNIAYCITQANTFPNFPTAVTHQIFYYGLNYHEAH